MSAADLAIAGLVAINLAAIADRHYLAKRIADRVRVVSPPKQPKPAEADDRPVSITERRAS